MITGVVLRYSLNRLLYNNVITLNDSVVDYLDGSNIIDYQMAVENINNISGVDIVIYDNQNIIASTFDNDIPDINQGVIASKRYDVWRLRVEDKSYYYTIKTLDNNGYDIYVLRSDSIVVNVPNSVYFTSLLGVYFFVLAISSVIFYASQSFVNPIRVLRDYANMISPENPKQPIQVFSIREFNELGETMESTWERLNSYRDYQREFLHNFSHEMKTPLTNIYGYTEGIKYNILNEEEKQKGLEIILKETDRLKNTIDQILLMGRIESVEYKLQPKKINLNNIIGDALNSVQIEATNANIELFFSEEKEYFIFGESDRLENAFINILSNGIRYAKSKLCIKIENKAENYSISIEDDGVGVSDQDKERIFERFFIGEKGHTGLGLTISKVIIEKHSGTIRVENGETCGAKFIINLPKIKL